MPTEHSVSQWISRLKSGDENATEKIWRRYYQGLVELARRKLHSKTRRIADEEDVAMCAFESFVQAANAGRFPNLRDRDDLWRLIAAITERKAVDQQRRQSRLKRGAGKVGGESMLIQNKSDDEPPGMDVLAGIEPTPLEAAITAETMKILLELLDPRLRQIAVGKLEGYTNQELSDQLSCSTTTIERKLSLIRKIWSANEKFGK
jgi:RNA polymerase sigma factor (sigma-70 family)